MASENGEAFVKSLAAFVRSHEKALANALQLRRSSDASRLPTTPASPEASSFLAAAQHAGVSSLTAALSSAVLPFSHPIKPAKLTLTPHHLFYLLSRFEDLAIDVGPMNVRLENIHADSAPSNYVSFLNAPLKPKQRNGKDSDSIHSVSSVRSVMSNMSTFWAGLSIPSAGTAKSEKARTALENDTKYLYSAFTKIPCLRLSQDRRARLISGYEEFPFDTAVPLTAFKNVSALEIYDTDFRQLYGWDRMAEQLRSLTVKRGCVEDPRDLLVSVVIDDIERRRRRSSKPHTPSTPLWNSAPCIRPSDSILGASPASPPAAGSSPRRPPLYTARDVDISVARTPSHRRDQSSSPTRPKTARIAPSYRKSKGAYEMRRTGSGSSDSSSKSGHRPSASRSTSNLLAMGILPPTKWRLLRHLSLADNGLTHLSSGSLSTLNTSLVSLDLSSNLFTQIPDGLALIGTMRALNLSSCLIESLASLADSPLLAVESFNLRANKLKSLMGIERLCALERIDVRDNRLTDPAEIGRLTSNPKVREVYVSGNPFTKTHHSYRIHIFNLFRATPGYLEDVRIDGSGPSYTERKHLKDRAVTESEPVEPEPRRPVFNETHVVRHPSSSTRATLSSIRVNDQSFSPMDTSASKSARKKMQTRKRLVGLSTEQHFSSTTSPQLALAASATSTTGDSDVSVSRSAISSKSSISEHIPPASRGPVIDSSSEASDGEAYRRHVESLKREYGGEWLKAMGAKGHENLTGNATVVPATPTSALYSAAGLKQSVGTGTRAIG